MRLAERGQVVIDSSASLPLPASGSARPPDVVIAGAPKCGTTSLYRYLKEHPNILASPIKEPNFFCFDSPQLRVVNQWSDYEGLFRGTEKARLRLEASTAYLLSPTAIPAILENNPRTKIIVALRNPIDMIVSYHAQKVYAFEEDELDFHQAWQLSEFRARGERVPAQCRAATYLDYRSVAQLGEQIARIVRHVPADQLYILFFDELSHDAARVYSKLLDFLGLPSDCREEFAVANPRKIHAWPALSRIIVKPPPLMQDAKRVARAAFPRLSKGAGRFVHRLLQKPLPRTAVAPELRRQLASELRSDIEKLASLLNRDLSEWTSLEG